MASPDLLTAWRTFDSGQPPYLLRGDEALLSDSKSVTIKSTDELVTHPQFDFRGDGRVHLGLLPVPFLGNLGQADIFILLQNPGFRPSDYFAELRDDELKEILKANLTQDVAEEFPFPLLNPRFSYHGGYNYWRGKLAGILDLLRSQRGVTLAEAMRELSRRIAILELFPYHSSVGGLRPSVLRRLRSVDLARRYVHEHLIPRAQRGEVLLIATRKARQWNLEEGSGVIVYGGSEARSAHLTPASRGGAAMAERLGLMSA